MDHKDVVKMIPDFLDDNLDNATLSNFLDHIDRCGECKEELTIQFLVETGMQRLEDGKNFNLNKELTLIINDMKRKCEKRKHVRKVAAVMELLVFTEAAALIAMAIYLLG